MIKKLLIFLAVLAGLAALADRGLAVVAGNATAAQIRLHEGLREDPDVTFRGFPFLTQAVKGDFRQVDVTVRDLSREGLNVDRIDASLHDVRVDLGEALKGRVSAVPIGEGRATVRLTYADVTSFLARRPGNIRVAERDGRVVVLSSFGIPNAGQVEVSGTPTVRVGENSLRVTVSNVTTVDSPNRLTPALAAQAGARSSFTLPLSRLPFGIAVERAELTSDALVVSASAKGLVIDVAPGGNP
jgi:hypothetical protein